MTELVVAALGSFGRYYICWKTQSGEYRQGQCASNSPPAPPSSSSMTYTLKPQHRKLRPSRSLTRMALPQRRRATAHARLRDAASSPRPRRRLLRRRPRRQDRAQSRIIIRSVDARPHGLAATQQRPPIPLPLAHEQQTAGPRRTTQVSNHVADRPARLQLPPQPGGQSDQRVPWRSQPWWSWRSRQQHQHEQHRRRAEVEWQRREGGGEALGCRPDECGLADAAEDYRAWRGAAAYT